MRYRLAAALVMLGFAVSLAAGAPSPARAADEPEAARPGELAREGVDSLLRALGAMIEMIPQYELPEINENGDIVIRRKRKADDRPPPEPEFDETSA